jgi:outer membrane protein
MRRMWIVVVTALCASRTSAANQDQALPRLRLTMAEAVERALASAPRLAQARALGRAGEADARVARSARWPQLELSAGYARNSEVPELRLAFPDGTERTLFPNIPDNYRARGSVTWPLFSGGRISSGIGAAERDATAVERDQETDRQDLVLETRNAYWSVVLARELSRVLAEGLAAYDAHLKDAKNREAVGLTAANEVLAVQVERDRAELASLRAQNAAAIAQTNLARLVGVPLAAELELTEALRARETDAAEDSTNLEAAALERRSELGALEQRLAAAEARVRVERAALLPQVALAAGYDYANPNRKIMPPEARWRDSWDLGVNLSLNVLDGGRAAAAVARARGRRDAVREQLRDLRLRIGQQVRERDLALRADTSAVAVAERAVLSARENRRVAEERYRAGVLGSSELLDAEVALLRADLERVESLARQRLTAAALDRAVGR